MFRKFVCVFLIVWLVASPAYAATSSSALDWSVVPMNLDDGIMTAASNITFDFSVGNYSLENDSFVFSSVYTVNSSPILVDSPVILAGLPYQYYDSANPFIAFRVRLSNLDLSDGDYLNILLNRICLYFWSPSHNLSLNMDMSTLSPIRSYVKYNWSGTGKRNNSFTTISGSGTSSLDFSFQNSSVSYLSDGGTGAMFSNRPVSDLSFSFSPDIPSTFVDDGYEYEVQSASVSSAELYVVFPFSSQNFGLFPDVIFDDSVNFTFRFVSTYAGGQPKYYLNTFDSGTSSTGALFASLNQTISSLSTSITKQITEVKQTVSQGASQVKDAISNQTQTLTDKLTDVKDGIVNGITELKETTEQGFTDVVQGITDLPGKMQEMLTDFIVPDEDTVADKMTDFQSLAEEKLGVIYQVPTMMFDMAEGIISGVSNPEGEMVLPKFEIIMPATNQTRSGETLTVWEEYRFAIWPAGTEVIQTAVQTATSMICVIFTFNALKRKYEEWLDGH